MNRRATHGLPYQWVAEVFPKDNSVYVWLITNDKRMYRTNDITDMAIRKLFAVMTGGVTCK